MASTVDVECLLEVSCAPSLSNAHIVHVLELPSYENEIIFVVVVENVYYQVLSRYLW